MKKVIIVSILFIQWASFSQNDVLSFEVNITPDNLKIGFFSTFEDFVANNAITGINIKVQKRSTEKKLHLKDADTKKKIKHFAYYDGEILYINASIYSVNRHYVKTEWLNEYLMFNDKFENPHTAEDLSLAFGLLGALASNQEQFVFLDLETSIYYTITKGQLIKLIKTHDEELFNANQDNIADDKVLKHLLQELNKKMGKEAFYEILFE